MHFDENPPRLHHALRVRDACGLRIASTVQHPPAVAGVDEDIAGQLSAEGRAQAGALWPAWWSACITAAYVDTLPDGPLVKGQVREDLNRALAVAGHPPDFITLADRPALQRAAEAAWRRQTAHPFTQPSTSWDTRQTFETGVWPEGVEKRQQHIRERDELTASVVREVTTDHATTAGRVQACLHVVAGGQHWWQLARPGVAVLTTSLYCSPLLLRRVLKLVLISSLDPRGY